MTVPPKSHTEMPSSLALTSTEDDDSFKAKFENLRILVKHLQRELALERLRADGLQSIANCLEEEREENVYLREKVLCLQQQNNGIPDLLSPGSKETNNAGTCESKEQRQILQCQLLKVNNQLVEVTQMNSRWQQYNQQREEFVQQLLQQNTSLELRLTEMKCEMQIKERETSDLGHITQDLKNIIKNLESDNKRTEYENKRLLEKVVYLQESNSQTEQNNRYLQREFDMLKVNTPSDYKEKIGMLEAQIRICTEDFESERKDRERAISRCAELDKLVKNLQAEKKLLQQQLISKASQRRQWASQNNQTSYQKMQGLGNTIPGAGSLFQTDCEEGPRMIYEDNEPVSHRIASDIDESCIAENNLQCPKCGQEFLVQQHTELLEHIDECCE